MSGNGVLGALREGKASTRTPSIPAQRDLHELKARRLRIACSSRCTDGFGEDGTVQGALETLAHSLIPAAA